jgi:3-polyprenyl-4-hydroxybenzoate decarboxylase
MTIWIDKPYFRDKIGYLFDNIENKDIKISTNKKGSRKEMNAILPSEKINLNSHNLEELKEMLGSIRTGDPSVSISHTNTNKIKITLEANKEVFDLKED